GFGLLRVGNVRVVATRVWVLSHLGLLGRLFLGCGFVSGYRRLQPSPASAGAARVPAHPGGLAGIAVERGGLQQATTPNTRSPTRWIFFPRTPSVSSSCPTAWSWPH